MSKAIRWQLHFHEAKPDSQNPKHYRVDIYDEQDGTWSGITQLTAGDQPFVTDEDASDDFFCPVRTQTGTLQICTLKPDGQYITLDELLPANNIARPVMLLSISGNTETIEWQGFLSCEAYSQDYVGLPQTLSFPVNGILEAMASVQLNPATTSGLKRAYQHIYDTLHEIEVQSGVTCFTHVRYSMTDWRIFQKYIDATVFFDRKEYNNENSTTYIVSGLSCKDVLERLAAYMGWTVRENKREVLFERIGESLGMYQQTLSAFGSNFHPHGTPAAPIITRDLATDADWMGTGHQRSIAAGAKSVEVVAKLEKYDLQIGVPECPVGDLVEIYRQLWKYEEDGDWLYLLANQNASAYSHMSVANYKAQVRYSYFHFANYGTTTIANVLSHMSVGTSSSAYTSIHGDPLSMYWWYAGAFLCRYVWENTGDATRHDVSDALYCVFFPHSLNYQNNPDIVSDFDPSQVGAIFSINNVTNYRCDTGYLQLVADADTVFIWPSSDYVGMDMIHSSQRENEWMIAIELQFGDKWWNGSAWQSSWCTFKARMTKNGFKGNWNDTMTIEETDGLLIPIIGDMQGLVTLKIWPMASPTNYSESNTAVLEMIFSSLSLAHVMPEKHDLTDRGENHYYRLLGTNFRDEISINTDLASMLNNMPSPSLIMEDSTTPMKTLNYVGLGEVRPEVDLLNRLAAYYGAARQRLELEVAHPTAAPLPLLKLNGINDGKVYLPLSESRDWRTDVCKLTCFELPEQPSES